MVCAQGFFYNRYTPIGNATGQSTGANKDQQLWYHVVGTPQAQDAFVLALPEQPDWSIGAGVTDDEKCARPGFFREMPFGGIEQTTYTQWRPLHFNSNGCRAMQGKVWKQRPDDADQAQARCGVHLHRHRPH